MNKISGIDINRLDHEIADQNCFEEIKKAMKYEELFLENEYRDVSDKMGIEFSRESSKQYEGGGIDINPIRSNKKTLMFKNFRVFNQ